MHSEVITAKIIIYLVNENQNYNYGTLLIMF